MAWSGWQFCAASIQAKMVNPMVVLLDLNMPRMDGLEFLTEIRADAILHSTVIFVLTTSSRDADRSQSYQRNIAGYMVKSEVGPQFAKLARLLTAYGDAVSLPWAWPCPRRKHRKAQNGWGRLHPFTSWLPTITMSIASAFSAACSTIPVRRR